MHSQNQPNIIYIYIYILLLIDAIIVCGNLTLNHRERRKQLMEIVWVGERNKTRKLNSIITRVYKKATQVTA